MNRTKNSVEFGEIRSTLRHHRDSSKRHPPFYRVDNSQADSYFKRNHDYRKQILQYFSKLRDRGIPIVHLDICGIATVQSLGGDMSYCFSLKDDSGFDYQGNQRVQGDLFCGRDFGKFLGEVRAQPEAPALITFRPIVGIQDNDPLWSKKGAGNSRDVTEGILKKRFGQCVDVLRKWGYMYLEKPFQTNGMEEFFRGIPQEEWRLSRQVKKLAEKYNCNVKIEGSLGGPKFLLRKRRN